MRGVKNKGKTQKNRGGQRTKEKKGETLFRKRPKGRGARVKRKGNAPSFLRPGGIEKFPTKHELKGEGIP